MPHRRPLRSFFERDSVSVARELLGYTLVRVKDGRRLSGVIVEVEAYGGSTDPASHAYRGRSPRNAVMFGEGGHAYVYFVYGFHNCLNFTTEKESVPGAVLIRALEPKEGVEEMMKGRRVRRLEDLANGPGKLTAAMGIDRGFNGEDLLNSERLFVEEGPRPKKVQRSARVGIRVGTDRPWRFFVVGSGYVSRGKPSSPSQNP